MPKTLLLADDSVVIQKLVGLSFANEDVEIITADNGDDAISLATESRPDLVIADVIMPGKSGYEVCEAIKASPDLSHIPVLLLTGTFEAFDEERSQAVGSVGHITKPFEAQALVERVTGLLNSTAAATPPPIPSATTGDLEVTEESPAAGDAFDFFDEDVSDLSSENSIGAADPLADPFSPAPDTAGEPLDDLSETSTDLGIADLDAGMLGSDSTVALMPDEGGDTATELPTDLVNLDAALEDETSPDARSTEFLGNDASDGFPDESVAASPPAETVLADFGDFEEPAPSQESHASEPLQDTMSSMDVSDEFEFGSSESAPVENPAQTMLADELFADDAAPETAAVPTDLDEQLAAPEALDPNEDLLMLGDDDEAAVSLDPGSSAFDISSSDLGDLDVSSPSTDSADLTDSLGASSEVPPTESAPEAFDLPPTLETLESEPIVDGPAASAFDDLLEAPAVEPAAADNAFARDDFMTTDALSGSDFAADPMDSAAPADGVASIDSGAYDDASAPTFAPDVPEVAPVAAEFDAPARPAGGVDMTPMLQERLHETLEKVAWEAFSEISEQVVKQVLERVESIAWEVIPQMTEALVQEEIRKMKGEDESSE